MNSRFALAAFFFFCISFMALGQDYQYLRCCLIDHETQKSIPFVTIVIPQKKLGIIANADGDFRIRRTSVSDTDSVVFTCIGYQKEVVPIGNLRTNKVNKITLKPSVFEIDEVEVVAKRRRINSLKIVRRALKSIDTNCPQNSFAYVAYYRDYQKQEQRYLNLNEAIFEHKDKGFSEDLSESRFCLLSVRENENFERRKFPDLYGKVMDEEYGTKYIPGATLPNQGGNELAILLVHDAIRRKNNFSFSFVGTMLLDFVSNHKFKEQEIVFNDTLALYKIDFVSIREKTNDSIVASGSIYVEPDTYAIHNLNYSGFYKKEDGTHRPMFNVTLEYGRVEELDFKMGLKYISFNNLFLSPNPQDTNYFRIVEHKFNKTDLRLDLFFNGKVDQRSGMQKRNYRVSFGDKIAKIKSIWVHGNRVRITLKEEVFDYSKGEVMVDNIYNSQGRLVNQKDILEVVQFREMFVQEYNPDIVYKDKCIMMGLPLMENCVNDFEGEDKYWMNSPLAEEEK